MVYFNPEISQPFKCIDQKKKSMHFKSLISKFFHLLFSLWQIQYTHRSNWPKQAALWTKAEWGAATGFSPSRLNVQGQQHSLPAASNTMSPMPEAAAVFGLRRHCIVPGGYLGNNTVLKVLLRTWNVRINVRKGGQRQSGLQISLGEELFLHVTINKNIFWNSKSLCTQMRYRLF